MKEITYSRKLKALVASYGEGWTTNVIDFEPVAYKQYADGYEVEVSGVSNGGRSVSRHEDAQGLTHVTGGASVYLWRRDTRQLVKHAHNVEIADVPAIADALHKSAASLCAD